MSNKFTYQIMKSNNNISIKMTEGDEILEFDNIDDATRFTNIMNTNTDNGWTYTILPIKFR